MSNRTESSEPRREELVLYVLLVIIGAMPISGVLVDGARFGAEATIGLILFVLGGLGLVSYALRGGDGLRRRS